jgi:hypothetical protein
MLSRGGWALAGVAVLSVALLAPGTGDSLGDVHGQSFPDALLALACLVQLALSTWVLLAVVLGLVHAPAPVLRAVAPRLVRRALFAGTVGALALSPVHAERGVAPNAPMRHDLTGLRLPDRPVATPHLESGRAVVVVRPGDTLWSIARRALPAGATDAEIARACARWHAANRGVIGDDPDLIFPQQRLHPPLGKDPT